MGGGEEEDEDEDDDEDDGAIPCLFVDRPLLPPHTTHTLHTHTQHTHTHARDHQWHDDQTGLRGMMIKRHRAVMPVVLVLRAVEHLVAHP